MYLAAAIMAYGCDYDDIDKTDDRRYKFIFSNDVEFIWILDQNNVSKIINPSLDDIERKFFSSRLVFPANYPDALRRVKSAIHSG